MALNTRIRGEQILYDDVTIGVDSFKIEVKDGGIAALQLATDAVETLKIKDKNVTLGKMADMGAEAHILVANASLRPVSVAMSGDITISAAGVAAIGSGVIVNADVKSDAAIAESKLALDYSTSALDGRIDTLEGKFPVDTADIASDAIDATKIEDDAVGAEHINAGAESAGYVLTTDAVGGLTWTAKTVNTDVYVKADAAGSAGYLEAVIKDLDAAIVDVAADSMVITDGGSADVGRLESIADFVSAIAGSGLTATAGVLSVDAITDNIIEADIKLEDESANCNGVTVAFSLASTPVTNSVQVFLNGLLQQAGSGKDYTLSGTTVTFATAPETGDVLLIHYIVND